jgi:hypothetical protein
MRQVLSPERNNLADGQVVEMFELPGVARLFGLALSSLRHHAEMPFGFRVESLRWNWLT